MNITENQKKAFGFAGKNIVWSETLKFLQTIQETMMLQAISANTKGEDRIHFCGQTDAINYAISALIDMRKEARVLSGLTAEEDLA